MTISKKRGFTLIELLVVIAIIGVLSSVVLASLNTARQKSRDAKRQSDIKQLQLALQLYFDTNGSYPPTSGTTCVSAACAVSSTTLTAIISGGFIASTPVDPLAGRNYYYQVDAANGTNYCVGALLEGGTNTLDTCGAVELDGTECNSAACNFKLGP